MQNKYICWILKNIKSLWCSLLFILGVVYITLNYTRILFSPTIIDYFIISGTVILAFWPIISEITIVGFSVKKEIQNTKQEMREALIDLKGQLIDIKTTTTQNTTQYFGSDFLLSKSEINNAINKIHPAPESDLEKIDNNPFEVTDETLYLFKVRFSLEKYLNNIFTRLGYTETVPLIRKIDILFQDNIINAEMKQNIKQLLSICNRGIHGEIISKDYIEFIEKIIPQIYRELNKFTQRLGYKSIISCPICKYAGYSNTENVCPKCGHVTND